MISLKEKNDVQPLRPHCSEPLDEMWFRELSGLLGKRYVYFYARCRKVLGISHRKGFFMGQERSGTSAGTSPISKIHSACKSV